MHSSYESIFIVSDLGNLVFFDTKLALENKLEAIDVKDGAYEIFDGQGRERTLLVVTDNNGIERVAVEAEAGPERENHLKALITKFLNETGRSAPSAPDTDLSVFLDALRPLALTE